MALYNYYCLPLQAHPSVRIKGTEHNYNPVLCQDEKCAASSKGNHMHCPFCSIAEAYQDPVILRAHYRVKHVDKGIDFAGLKVLRCCNHCEIVGTIKGEKKFKGAHWHCYRCRNGFNRRDEAVKHYKTHFRNPHTTFQIQITQGVNSRQYYEQSAEAHPKAYGGLAITAGSNGDYSTIGSVLAQTVIATATGTETLITEVSKGVNSRQYYEQSAEAHPKAYGGLAITAGSNGDYSTIGSVLAQTVIATATGTETLITEVSKDSSVSNGITVGAEETVGPCPQSSGRQTLVLMDPDGESGNLLYEETTSIITEQDSSVSNGITVGAEETVGPCPQSSGRQTLVLMDPDGESGNLLYEETTSIITEQGGESLDQNLLLEKQLIELHQHNQALRQEKEEVEKKLGAEIQELKDHVAGLVQANVKMFEELQVYRAADDTEQKISKLVAGLVQANVKMFEELQVYRAADDTEQKISKLVESMERQHQELLQTQLAALRKEMLQEAVNGETGGTLQLALPQDSEEGGDSVISFLGPSHGTGVGAEAGITSLEIVEVQLQHTPHIPKIDSPPTSLYPAEELHEQGGLSPEKRDAEEQPEGESKTKIQRTV
ncbi:UNVERIFIED_CONTAM: hypothetical protein FKN15_063350 [Acipenser sinensis]